MTTTQAQNQAHRNDTVWTKTARGQYENFEGLVIRKNHMTSFWGVFLPNGQPVAARATGDYVFSYALTCHSLTYAKWSIDYYSITTESPAATN